MTLLYGLLFLVLYLLPFSFIHLNTLMTCINAKRTRESIDHGFLFLNTMFGSIPIFNLLLPFIIRFAVSEEMFLLAYLKGLNDPLQCSSCGIVTRRHYLKDVEPRKNYVDDYVYSNYTICPFCEARYKMCEVDKYRRHTLPFGKRISLLKGLVLFFTGGQSKKERQLKKLEKQQKELAFVDDQLASYAHLQEQKLLLYQEKAEEIKRSLELTGKKEVDHAKFKTTVD